MTSYWDIVPRGIWRVTDVVDAMNAISDPESTLTIDMTHDRIHVFGPQYKAIWIDLVAMKETATNTEMLLFNKLLDKVLEIHYI